MAQSYGSVPRDESSSKTDLTSNGRGALSNRQIAIGFAIFFVVGAATIAVGHNEMGRGSRAAAYTEPGRGAKPSCRCASVAAHRCVLLQLPLRLQLC